MSNQTQRKTFQFHTTPNYGIVHEDLSKLQSEYLYYDVYYKALEKVAEIVESNKHATVSHITNSCIAFVGGRGSGKSSSMASVADFLNSQKSITISDGQLLDLSNRLRNYSFCKLNEIEVSHMTVNTTILGNISAQMYDDIKEKNISPEKRRNFFECAKRVNRYALLSQTGNWANEENDSLLSDISTINNMKQHVHQMIKEYLQLKTGSDESYLVVQIDDLDMSINNIYTIVEEIYTYLSVPNIIVLMSVCEDQLKKVLATNYLSRFSNRDEEYKQLARNLASNYITKVLPIDRQIMMPDLGNGNIKRIYVQAANGVEKQSLQDNIFSLIHRKTMLLLCESKNQIQHPIIPTNTRALQNFYHFLSHMSDIYDKSIPTDSELVESDKLDILHENLNRLGNYIRTHYLDFNIIDYTTMSHEHIEIVTALRTVIDHLYSFPLDEMNAFILRTILSIFSTSKTIKKNKYLSSIFMSRKELKKNPEQTSKYLKTLLAYSQHPQSISMGDVLYVLGQLDKKIGNDLIKYLVEIIRVLWSIRMTDQYFFVYINPNNPQENNDFYSAVGGFIFNPDAWSVGGFDEWIRISLSVKDIVELFTEEQQKFISLFTSFAASPINAVEPSDFRAYHSFDKKPYYMYNFDNVREQASDEIFYYFHPLSFFSNALAGGFSFRKKFYGFNLKDQVFTKPVCLLPVYSLDFMAVFYDAYQISIREQLKKLKPLEEAGHYCILPISSPPPENNDEHSEQYLAKYAHDRKNIFLSSQYFWVYFNSLYKMFDVADSKMFTLNQAICYLPKDDIKNGGKKEQYKAILEQLKDVFSSILVDQDVKYFIIPQKKEDELGFVWAINRLCEYVTLPVEMPAALEESDTVSLRDMVTAFNLSGVPEPPPYELSKKQWEQFKRFLPKTDSSGDKIGG